MVKISKYPSYIDYILVVTCLVNAFLTVFIIIYPEWTFINMMATEPSILNGHRFGPFRRCFSRFTIGVEQTCDDYIAPFWQLPKSLLFIRTSLIVSAITIITATLTTLFSMSCVYQGQMNEASKTWLRLFNIFLRLSAGVLILLCVSLYATMVIHDDIRASDIQSLEPNTQPFRYEVYNLWGRCIWIGWAESCTEILLNLYALFAWMDPVGQAKKLEQKKADADFKSLYNYVLSPDVTPSDPLFGRLFREFRKRCISVYPLVKVRSASQSPLLQSVKYRKIANDISVVVANVQELPDLSFDSSHALDVGTWCPCQRLG